MSDLPTRVCAHCGRRFAWRKKWERDWDSVRHCSQRCRRARLDETDRALEAAILRLCGERAAGATICPSEATRAVGLEGNAANHERTRRAARRLVAREEIEICQRGRVVDASTAKGAIRLRKRP